METTYGDLKEVMEGAKIYEPPADGSHAQLVELSDALAKAGMETAARMAVTEAARVSRLESVKNYLCFDVAEINAFLEKLVVRYDEKHAPKTKKALSLFDRVLMRRREERATTASLTTIGSMAREQLLLNMVQHAPTWTSRLSMFEAEPTNPSRRTEQFESRGTVHRLSTAPGTIGKFLWKEEHTKSYAGIPPKHAVAALTTAKETHVFDYFTVASVEGVRDPLLLGRVDGSTKRFVIAQWGSDIALDDIVNAK